MKKKPSQSPDLGKESAGDAPDGSVAEAPAAANPPSAPPPTPPAAETAESRLAAAATQLAELQDRYLRLAAEFDNYRKRIGRELQEGRTAAQVDVLLSVLNVFDHFLLAMTHAENDADPAVLRSGMKMILAEFERAFAEVGVDVIDAVGQPFDPQWHEASSREPSATVPENHILRQWRCGYRLGERLLRPAAVVVSAGPAATPPATGAKPGPAPDDVQPQEE
jgi:molecular chaperone GrpE